MIATLLLAAACSCPGQREAIDWAAVDRAPDKAARKTDRDLALDKLRAELDAIVRRIREEFERRPPNPEQPK